MKRGRSFTDSGGWPQRLASGVLAAWLGAGSLAAAEEPATAAQAARPTGPLPAARSAPDARGPAQAPSLEAFRLIYERNVFDPNRRASSGRPFREPPRPKKVERFSLVGTLIYDQAAYAFFSGSDAKYQTTLGLSDSVAGLKLIEIRPDAVKFDCASNTLELSMDKELRREEDGAWQLAAATGAREGSSGGFTPAASTGSEGSSTSGSGRGGGDEDALKRLLQRREQEAGGPKPRRRPRRLRRRIPLEAKAGHLVQPANRMTNPKMQLGNRPMKTSPCLKVLASVALATLLAAAQQPADSPNPADAEPVVSAPTNTPAAPANPPTEAPPTALTNAPPATPPSPAAATAPEAAAPAAAAIPEVAGANGLLLNFRGAPLEAVLNYLSKAAGFIFVPDQGLDVKGRVDIWSQQPVSKEEAVDLLNTVLNKNGYAAVRSGRTVSIMNREEAKKRDIPVRTGSDPDAIPRTDEMVTQIIPVRYANAVQMTKDLQPLLPTYANMTANESGNALVITDTQSDIRRMAQIVKALDTSISGISTIRVFPLRYADAKDLANEIKELFPAPSTSGRGGNDPRANFMARFMGGPGGPGGGGGAQSDGSQSEARRAASRVTAVADERTNSLVVSAPDEIMPTIDQLVKEIDTNAENITEVRVFRLVYADATEMADLLTSLFPDDTRSDSSRSAVQFGRGPFGGGPGGGPFGGFGRGMANTQTSQSTRARQKGKVTAVPDPRTGSVIVSAASDLMPQIAEMITQLDANPAKKQKVFVYSLENADVDSVQQVLQEMFQSQDTRTGSSASRLNSNPLATRQQNQNFGTTSSGFGNNSTLGQGSNTRRVGGR